MADIQLSLPGEIVKKHNELVRSKITGITSKTASRILACLIATVHQDDTQFQSSYRIPIKDFLPDDGNLYRQAKDACRELLRTIVETESPDPDNPNGEPIWNGATFFLSIKYRQGFVTASFNPKLSPLLLQLRQCFTEYNLWEYLSLPSLYSQRLFEILKSWSGLPEVIISVKELHKILNSPESLCTDFAQFRRRVLEKAYKDIKSHTELRYEWETVKIGRSVEQIRFIFSEKRRALPEKEKEKAKVEKQARLRNQRFLRAARCVKEKHGFCTEQNNKPIICKLCCHMNLCEDFRRYEGKNLFSNS